MKIRTKRRDRITPAPQQPAEQPMDLIAWYWSVTEWQQSGSCSWIELTYDEVKCVCQCCIVNR